MSLRQIMDMKNETKKKNPNIKVDVKKEFYQQNDHILQSSPQDCKSSSGDSQSPNTPNSTPTPATPASKSESDSPKVLKAWPRKTIGVKSQNKLSPLKMSIMEKSAMNKITEMAAVDEEGTPQIEIDKTGFQKELSGFAKIQLAYDPKLNNSGKKS